MAATKRPAAKKTRAAARKPAAKRAVKKPPAKKTARKPVKKAAKKAVRKAAKPVAKRAAGKSKYALKTVATPQNVGQFLAGIADATKRADAEEIARMMSTITGVEPKMWGPSIVGFGQYHYKYESGHEGDMCIAGFSPRKDALTLYILPGFERYADLMDKLGRYKIGKSCLYVKRLDDVDRDVLRTLIERSVALMAPNRTA